MKKLYPLDINEKLDKLASIIRYEYKNIKYLRNAFDRNPIETKFSSENYVNSSLATLGDAVLKLVITEKFYHEGKPKGEITDDKKGIESNVNLEKYIQTFDVTQYAFKKDYYSFEDEQSGRDKVSIGGHEEFVEAIIGAIYLDRGLKYVREWIIKNIMNM